MNEIMTHDELMTKHNKILKKAGYLSIGAGWYPIIDRLCTNLQKVVDTQRLKQVEAVQVKEKFGGLRFYTDNCDPLLYSLIRAAELESDNTCDVCGKPGTLRSDGWMVTRCDEHA